MNFFEYLYYRTYLGYEKQDGPGWLPRYSAAVNTTMPLTFAIFALLRALMVEAGLQSKLQFASELIGLRPGAIGLVFLISFVSAWVITTALFVKRHNLVVERNNLWLHSSFLRVAVHHMFFSFVYLYLALSMSESRSIHLVMTLVTFFLASTSTRLFFQRTK